MHDGETAPAVRLHIVDEVRLPATTVAELAAALRLWILNEEPPIDVAHCIDMADLAGADIVLVELVAEAAQFDDLRNSFRAAELEPGGVADVIRLFLWCEDAMPPFPFICLRDITPAKHLASPLIERAGARALSAKKVNLFDDVQHLELGWTDHCLLPARRSGFVASVR